MFDKEKEFELIDIKEHNESVHPYLYFDKTDERWTFLAFNEGGFNSTLIDLFDVIDWIDKNREEIEKNRS